MLNVSSRSSIIRKFLFTSILIILLNACMFQNAMYSPLNHVHNEKEEFHNTALIEAQSFFDQMPKFTSPYHPNWNNTNVSIVILTHARKRPYLQALLWSLVAFNNFNNTQLVVLNTVTPSTSHELYYKMKQYQLPFSFETLQIVNQSIPWERQLVHHHLMAMKTCRQSKSMWCIVFEEDGIVTKNFISKFHTLVKDVLVPSVGFVKLFVSDHYSGFDWSWNHAKELLVLFLLSLGLVGFVLSICPKHLPTQSKRNRVFITLVIITFFTIYASLRCMGRQSIINWWYGRQIRLEKVGATPGTVAVAYSSANLASLMAFLEHEIAQHGNDIANIDILLNRWILTSQKVMYRSRPSLVQHIGVFSSALHKNQGNFQYVKMDSAFEF